mmetsp:Transcript_153101/g.285281  ORF Transcript_153101/g.285281 Transcript_153101/m.285281 type:complete len:224 (-) Transcript_153101:415-1086(-)
MAFCLGQFHRSAACVCIRAHGHVHCRAHGTYGCEFVSGWLASSRPCFADGDCAQQHGAAVCFEVWPAYLVSRDQVRLRRRITFHSNHSPTHCLGIDQCACAICYLFNGYLGNLQALWQVTPRDWRTKRVHPLEGHARRYVDFLEGGVRDRRRVGSWAQSQGADRSAFRKFSADSGFKVYQRLFGWVCHWFRYNAASQLRTDSSKDGPAGRESNNTVMLSNLDA